ncbi:hypothetical protein Tco_0598245 [Tanacetum coccineum]
MTTLKFADTHNMVAFLSKPEESDGFEQIVDFLNAHQIKYALTVNLIIYTSCTEQFWSTVKAKTVNREVQLQALVDGKKVIVTEASVRSDLQLDDKEGMDCLPNATIFEELTRMGSKTTAWNEFCSTMASTIICLATNQKFNFLKYIFESMVKNLENVFGKFLMYPRFVQVFLEKQLEGMSNHNRIHVAPSHTKKIFGNMKRVGKGFSGRVTPLFLTMVVQAQEEMGEADEAVNEDMDDSLVRAATTASSLEVEQDNGGCIKLGAAADIDADEGINLVSTHFDADTNMFGVINLVGDEVVVESEVAVKAASIIPVSAATTTTTVITDDEITLAKALAELKSAKLPTTTAATTITTASTRPKAKGIVIHEREQAPTPIQRRKHFAAKRAEEKRNGPPTRAQQRSFMCTYLKNIEGWKPKNLKNKSFANIQELFDKATKRVNTFVDYRTELKQKVDEDKETTELQRLIEIIPDKEEVAIDAIPLATKPPSIVDYKIHKEGKKTYYQIIRADGSSKMYLVFSHMLKSFDKEDLETLWKLGRIVEIKRLPDDLEVTAAKVSGDKLLVNGVVQNKECSLEPLAYGMKLMVTSLTSMESFCSMRKKLRFLFGPEASCLHVASFIVSDLRQSGDANTKVEEEKDMNECKKASHDEERRVVKFLLLSFLNIYGSNRSRHKVHFFRNIVKKKKMDDKDKSVGICCLISVLDQKVQEEIMRLINEQGDIKNKDISGDKELPTLPTVGPASMLIKLGVVLGLGFFAAGHSLYNVE